MDRSFENNMPDPSNGNNADLYGTLPRRKTQKSQDHTRQCNNQKMEAEVYRDFLEGQRTRSGGHSRSSSGAQTPVNELDDLSHPGPHQGGQYSDMNTQTGVQNHRQSYEPAMVSREISQPGMSFTYSRMSQGLKPIPVQPPKIENQSKHAEVGNQSRAPALPPRQPVSQIAHEGRHTHTNNNVSKGCFINTKENKFSTNGSKTYQMVSQLDYSTTDTISSHIESFEQMIAGTESYVPVQSLAFNNIHTATSTKLASPTRAKCDAVIGASCNHEGSRRRGDGLRRSVSFSHPVQSRTLEHCKLRHSPGRYVHTAEKWRKYTDAKIYVATLRNW